MDTANNLASLAKSAVAGGYLLAGHGADFPEWLRPTDPAQIPGTGSWLTQHASELPVLGDAFLPAAPDTALGRIAHAAVGSLPGAMVGAPEEVATQLAARTLGGAASGTASQGVTEAGGGPGLRAATAILGGAVAGWAHAPADRPTPLERTAETGAPRPLPPIGNAELDAVRKRYGLTNEQGQTIAAARTNIPGLELERLKDGTRGPYAGLSQTQRDAAGLPRLSQEAPDRRITSPYENDLFVEHAEEDAFNRLDRAITDAGLTDAQLAGKAVQMHISNQGGVCNKCTAGLLSDLPKDGVVKQFSLRHPTLRIEITAEGGDAVHGKHVLVVMGGKVVP